MPSQITHEIKEKIEHASAHGGRGPAAEHVYLFAAVVAALLAGAIWWGGIHGSVKEGIFHLLRIVSAVAGCGFLVRATEARVRGILTDQAIDAEKARREGYAQGYVDGVAKRTPEQFGHLTAIK